MNILVVSQYFWPENFRVNDLVEELVDRGHHVTILTGLPNYPSGEIFSDYKKSPHTFQRYQDANIIRVPILPRGEGGFRLLMNYISFVVSASSVGVWQLRSYHFDSIFVFEPSPITVGIPAVILKKTKHAPVIFWVLDLWPETLWALGVIRSKIGFAIIGSLVRFIYRHCDVLLGQSKEFLNKIAEYCDGEKTIRYFPSWAENIYNVNCGFAPEIEKNGNIFNILFAGNIGEAQDFPAILDAVEQLKNTARVRWLIVGDGRMAEWVRHEVLKRELQSSFEMLGRFPVERMPEFFKHADALLVSLKSDPFLSLTIPGKVQSYLLAGLPIIGMLDGAGAEVIREAGAGIVCHAGDGKGLAKAVKEMSMMSFSQRAEMGNNGKKYAEVEFNRNMLIDRLEGWMEEIASVHKQNL